MVTCKGDTIVKNVIVSPLVIRVEYMRRRPIELPTGKVDKMKDNPIEVKRGEGILQV